MPRNRLLLFTLLGTIVMSPHAAYGRQLAITVRNQPIHAAAVVDKGHVMLPMRVTFESLNSSVWYDGDSGIITARNILHVLHLKVGSSTAILDGRAVGLETPPRLVNGSVYVPVGFAAQAMGAIIRYDAATNVLAVNGSPPAPRVRERNVASQAQTVASQVNAVPQTAYPVISAPPVYYAVPGTNAVMMSQSATSATTMRTPMGQTASPQWGFIAPPPFNGFPFVNVFPPGVVTGGLTIVGPPTGNGYGPVTNPFIPFLPWSGTGYGQVFISNLGGSGITVTGDPLHPLGQYPASPIVNPIFPPFFPIHWP